MAGKKGMKAYSREVKLEAMRLYFEEGWTQRQITEELRIRDPKRIETWVRLYRREGAAAFSKRIGRPPKVADQKAYIRQLEMENALLKKYHTELRERQLAKRDIGSSTTTGDNTQ